MLGVKAMVQGMPAICGLIFEMLLGMSGHLVSRRAMEITGVIHGYRMTNKDTRDVAPNIQVGSVP